MPEFHDTRMGQKFYEHTVPALVTAANDIAKAIREHTEFLHKRQMYREIREGRRSREDINLTAEECFKFEG